MLDVVAQRAIEVYFCLTSKSVAPLISRDFVEYASNCEHMIAKMLQRILGINQS